MKNLLLITAILGICFYANSQTQTATEFYNNGNDKYNEGNYEEALKDYNEAINAHPKFASDVYNNRAVTKLKLKDDGALQDLYMAIELNKDHAYANYNIGLIKAKSKDSKDYPKALWHFDKAIDNGAGLNAYYNRGILRYHSGDSVGACSDFSKAGALANYQDYELSEKKLSAQIDRLPSPADSLQMDSFINPLLGQSAKVDSSLNQALINYQLFSLDHRRNVFKWQFYSSIIIFVIVLLIVITGLILSYMHFKRSLNSKADSETELEIGSTGLKIKTSIIGIIILVISIVFFYLYLVHVYEIKEIAASSELVGKLCCIFIPSCLYA